METQQNFSREERFLMAQKKVEKIRGFYIHLAVYVIINLFLAISAGIKHGVEGFVTPLLTTGLFWGIGLAFHWFGAIGKDMFFGKDWEQRKIKEMMEQDRFEQ